MSSGDLTPEQYEMLFGQTPQDSSSSEGRNGSNPPVPVDEFSIAVPPPPPPTNAPQQPVNLQAQPPQQMPMQGQPQQFQQPVNLQAQPQQQPANQVIVNNNIGSRGVIGFKGPNHILHLLLSIFTAGLWLPVWLVVALRNKQKPIYG